ncbi:dihydrofolate reductase family protein [Oceanicoccus sagamiensis]|uniref:Deaminase n=1 Tax=Oceanicoccus sagamiensis TaxID=716816 RepID=A0A1X9NFY4_9GAMM|nr:dihydrofolate reductase family protein [Oceanicoccus sagamiensis]ARN75322.1 deaminase [Oceanicoccus sagamiensis]
MSIHCSVYSAVSVDGFIAKPDGDIEWLHNPHYAGATLNGLDYESFIATVDTLVMGRHSYEKVRSFGFWPYDNIPVIVLTSRPLTVPPELEGKISVENCAPERLVSKLAEQGRQHLYIDGGATIQRFLTAGLINEITLTQIPVLLGAGISLFGDSGIESSLQLISADSSDNGFVQCRYTVKGC